MTTSQAPGSAALTGDEGTAALQLVDVHKSFGELHVIKGCNLSVATGSVLALVGANGAGKTTLFNLISGVLRCDQGRVFMSGRDITGLSPRRISRGGLGRTFQNLRVFGSMTVRDNILVSVEDSFFRHRRGQHLDAVVEEAVRIAGLQGLESTPARDLSYAEQKFLSIARVYARRPRIVLLDEPASGLDEESRGRLRALIEGVQRTGATIVLVEHNLQFVTSVASDMAFLDFGVVRAQGRPDDVMRRPELVEAYFGE